MSLQRKGVTHLTSKVLYKRQLTTHRKEASSFGSGLPTLIERILLLWKYFDMVRGDVLLICAKVWCSLNLTNVNGNIIVLLGTRLLVENLCLFIWSLSIWSATDCSLLFWMHIWSFKMADCYMNRAYVWPTQSISNSGCHFEDAKAKFWHAVRLRCFFCHNLAELL